MTISPIRCRIKVQTTKPIVVLIIAQTVWWCQGVFKKIHKPFVGFTGGIDMTFGEKLRKFRLQKKMSQQDLAKAAGLGINTIRNYEKGSTYPQNRGVYARLAEILGVSPDYLHNENDDFVVAAAERYGYSGKKQAMKLVEEMGGLFAGGELSDDDIDGVMKALQDYYWKAKEENKKYTPKKYRSSESK